MMRMDFDLALQGLYGIYNLPAPEGAALDDMYDMLGKLPDAALHDALREYRENHQRMGRGENVALSLKKYAKAYRPPSVARERATGACPEGCRGGFLWFRFDGSSEPPFVAPCVHCLPDMPQATTRASLARAFSVLAPDESICA